MKRNVSILLCLTLAASLAALAQTNTASATPPANTTTTPAAPTGPTKVGIINMQQAIIASNEGQTEFQKLAKKLEPRQTELQKMNGEVQDLRKQLETQGEKLNEDAKANLQRSIDTKQKTLQRNAEDYQTEAQQQQNEIASKILDKMYPVLDKYAKENQFALIIDVSQQWPQGEVLWADPSRVDITKAVVDAYNVVSGVPAPPAPAAGTPNAPRPGAAVPGTAPRTPATTPRTPAKPPTTPPKG